MKENTLFQQNPSLSWEPKREESIDNPSSAAREETQDPQEEVSWRPGCREASPADRGGLLCSWAEKRGSWWV